MAELIREATWQTCLMILIASSVGVIIGIPLAVLLYVTEKNSLFPQFALNRVCSFIINVIRSIPYIILVVILIPLTRFLTGTSIGTTAASIPLSFASIVLMSRSIESALHTVPRGLIEAALSMGASRLQVITKVLLSESLPQIIAGITLVTINLIGFSAMAGVVGGGGLGDLAIRCGYQRYEIGVMIQVVVILIILVQIIQTIGHFLVRKLSR